MSALSTGGKVVRIGLIIAAFAAVFTAAILYFQQKTVVAEFVACNKIDDAIKEANAAYEAAVNAELDVYKNQKKAIDDELMACLNTPKADPCADLQKQFDEAAKNFNSIQSPNVQMPGADLAYGSAAYNNAWNAYKNAWDSYYTAREEAYKKYKPIRDALFKCRADNPPKEVDDLLSDTKQCYKDYDAELKTIRDTFDSDTVALRAARDALIKALEARRKACNPPKDSFTTPPGGSTGGSEGETTGGTTTTPPVELVNCQLLPDPDFELSVLKKRAAELTAELKEIDNSIDNANKRIKKLESALSGIPTSTPTYVDGPNKGQIITNLAEAQAARGVKAKDIRDQIDFLNSYIERKEDDKPSLQGELDEVTDKIKARENYIKKENEARQRAFPTAIHQSRPETHVVGGCEYFHCHGILCGKNDPAPNSCGHGATSEDDKDCKKFLDSYLKAAGVK